MNIEALNVSLAAPQTTSSTNVSQTITTLNSDSTFAEKLINAKVALAKDKPNIINVNPSQENEDDQSLEKVKNLLSAQGFTQSEIDSIKNLKDLKKLLVSKSDDGTLKTGEDLTNLLSMLGSLLGPKAEESFADIKKLLDSVIPEIKTAATKYLNSGPLALDALKTFQDETDSVLSSNKQAIENLAPEDLKLFKAALTDGVNNVVKNAVNNPASSATNDLSIKIKNEIISILGKYKNQSITPTISDITLASTLPQIKESVIKAVNSGATTDAMNLFQNETQNILEGSKQAIQSLSPDDLKSFKDELTSEVENIAGSGTSDISSKIGQTITSILDKYKSDISDSSDIKFVKILPDVKLTTTVNAQNLTGNNLEDKSSSGSDILTKLVEPDSDTSKIDKATNFMTQFTNTTAPVKTDLTKTPIININSVNTDIVESLKYMQQGDIKNLTVTITPKQLGTVVINLIMQNGTMMASITASNKEAYNLINSNLPDISAKLQNLNIAVQDLSLNIYSQDTTFFKNGSRWQGQQEQQNNQNSHNKTTSILDAPKENVDQSLLNSNVNILA